MSMSSKSLGKNTVFLAICALLNKGLLFVMLPFFTRWLSVEEFGQYDVISTYISLLLPITTLATSNSIFRLSIDQENDDKCAVFSNGLVIYFVNAITVSILLITASSIIHQKNIWYFIALFLSVIGDNYFEGILRGLKELSLYGISRTISICSTVFFVTVLIGIFQYGLRGLILGYALGYFISIIYIIFRIRMWKYIRINMISGRKIKEIIKYSLPLVPNDISWWIIGVSDRQIINIFLGELSNGIYAVSCKIPNLCTAVFGVFNISWQESAIVDADENDKQKYYQKIFCKMNTVLITICIIVVSANFIFFDYIFDVRYDNARLYTPILIASVICSTISIFYGGIQISMKKTKDNGVSTVIGAVINLLIHFLLINRVGLYAAAISTFVANATVLLVRTIQIKKYYSFRIGTMNIVLILIFIVFACASARKMTVLFSIIELVVSTIIFMFFNRNYIASIVKKYH